MRVTGSFQCWRNQSWPCRQDRSHTGQLERSRSSTGSRGMHFTTSSFAHLHATFLLAALAVGAGTTGEAGAQATQKNGDSVRVTAAQLRQLDVVQVETYPFRLQRSAIGQ